MQRFRITVDGRKGTLYAVVSTHLIEPRAVYFINTHDSLPYVPQLTLLADHIRSMLSIGESVRGVKMAIPAPMPMRQRGAIVHITREFMNAY